MANLHCCPECGSTDVKYFEKKNRYTCNDCGESFEAALSERRPLRIFISYGRDNYAALAERLKKNQQILEKY